jgi:hypothetical protein
MRLVSTIALLATTTSVAAAEPDREAIRERYAVGVNNPIGWAITDFAISGWVGVDEHVAIRANAASYTAHRSVVDVIQHGIEVSPQSGRVNDVGAGAVWYPRRLWSGPMLEVGALVRSANRLTHLDTGDGDIERDTTLVAGRALVGWSWLLSRRVFFAASLGISVGRETGQELQHPSLTSPGSMATRIDKTVVDNEFYLRFGVAFGR